MSSKNIDIKYTKLFINNQFVDAVSKKTFPVLNPTNGKSIIDVAEADKADVDIAVAAAKAAFARGSEWRSMDPSARGQLLEKLANAILRDADQLAALETLNNGKPYENAYGDVQMSVKVLKYYAGYADKVCGKTIPTDGNYFTVTRKEPVGVAGQIIPWNFPIMMVSYKLGPALAAGCTLVLKPAEQTPLTALAVAALTKEVGFPDGVVNVLPGYGPTAGAAICLHNDVRKVAFTGSTEIGHLILEYSAKSNLKNVSLELGGKSPLVVFDDADVDLAVEVAHDSIFANHGQNCCAGSRTFVQAGIYDEFVKKAMLKAKARKVGDPFQDGIQQGPQIDQPSINKIKRLVQSGIKQGAKLETGGKQIGTEGFYYEPTVFSGVTDNMDIAKEEIFGPVQSILKFQTIDEVIERANNTIYGLASGVVTNNLENALVFAQAIEAGFVWINTYNVVYPQAPFGGYKKSGIGKDLGEDAVEEYLETKTIVVKVPSKN